MSSQIDLFGFNIRETPSFTWSHSRRQVLEQCPRKYYYHYYGSSSRTAEAEGDKEAIRFLKKLSNRHMRTGKIFHLIIRTYFTKLIEGETWELDRLLRWAKSIYEKDHVFSTNYNSSVQLTETPVDPVLLLEFYYNEDSADELYKESLERLLNAIRNFFDDSVGTSLQSVKLSPYLEVEKTISPKIHDFSTRGQIDLIHQNDNGVEIFDWKMGESNNSEVSLQLLYYAQWCIDELRCKPEHITVHKMSLLNRNVSSFNVSQKSLQRARARIIQDVEKMKAMHRYGENAVSEAFTPCLQPKICSLCQYQQVCLK